MFFSSVRNNCAGYQETEAESEISDAPSDFDFYSVRGNAFPTGRFSTRPPYCLRVHAASGPHIITASRFAPLLNLYGSIPALYASLFAYRICQLYFVFITGWVFRDWPIPCPPLLWNLCDRSRNVSYKSPSCRSGPLGRVIFLFRAQKFMLDFLIIRREGLSKLRPFFYF